MSGYKAPTASFVFTDPESVFGSKCYCLVIHTVLQFKRKKEKKVSQKTEAKGLPKDLICDVCTH